MKEPTFHRISNSEQKSTPTTPSPEKARFSPEARTILINLLNELKQDPQLKGWSSVCSMADLHKDLASGLLSDPYIQEAATQLINELMKRGEFEKVTEVERYFRF